MRVIVAITGASGCMISLRLLQELHNRVEVHLILSSASLQILRQECNVEVDELRNMATRIYRDDKLNESIASGTFKFDTLVIVPASTNTVAKIACGISDNLITRVAAVALKERRKVILVPRETPMSTVLLKKLYELSLLGVIIIPPVPAFYLKPKSVSDIVDYIVGKILDHMGLEHNLYSPYEP